MDVSWLLVAAMLVFLMQAGFLCLETGKIRSKNSINVAAKNLSDFIIAAIVFWMFGFGLMFGDSFLGLFGTDQHFFGANHSPWQFSFFFFQMMFCGTAATLLSGAVAERMSFHGYIFGTLILACIIYPVVGHWAWSGVYKNDNPGWLESLGFIDFAGSSIVHSVGGWVALAAVIIIGPRLGRYDPHKQLPVGNNLPMSVLGTILIWLGWFGFNGGSTLSLTDEVPKILLNTCLAAAWGGLASSVIFVVRNRYVDVTFIMNGVIAGLVSITAAAHAVTPAASAVIGIGGGVILYVGTWIMDKYQIDDVLSVVPAHLFAGIWGTLSVAFFGDPNILGTGLSTIEQLRVQALGIVVIGAYCFTISYVLLKVINHFAALRVSARHEMLGMNISEHHATTELIDLLSSMKSQERQGNFTDPVPVEPFTEVGQIARQYNRVIHRVQDEMSQRDRAIDSFRSSEKRKSAILDSSMDSIITIDLNGAIIEFNPAAERTFGRHKNQVVGKNFLDLFIIEEDRPTVRESLHHKFAASTGLLINRRNAIVLQRSVGDEFPAEITITGATFSSGELANEFTLHVRDVTRQRKLQTKLKQLAYSDPLTGLYNRTYLLETLDKTLSKSRIENAHVAVFFLDLDRFKKINDTLGHKAGDELLMEVAARLLKVTRDSDTIARWGGDEFVILMSGDLNERVCATTAIKILEVMRQPVILSNRELKIPTSIGVALSEDAEALPETLIQQADIAMYFAKEDGRDNFKLFKPEMANKANQQFDSEQELRIAIDMGNQFEVMYQYKVDHDSTLVGLEALVRWRRHDGSLTSPLEFISIAEEANLIIPLEEQVIESVCIQLSSWRESGKQLVPVAINLSGKHLLSDNLIAFVSRMLHEYELPGELIEFEVTEGVFLTDMNRCIQVLRQLKALKIKIAIDDFGTGYSSLNYLKSLPLDILKIDRSFVDECVESKEDSKICSTIIHLADSLGLQTVAEGVETVEQYHFLKQKGCTFFQGYYFNQPQSADVITQKLTANSAWV